ncbi:MAG: MFS transporter [Fimbriimonadaceae bacterium]|nr:MFS transporter [Fimbriimonadaceae bacterium]
MSESPRPAQGPSPAPLDLPLLFATRALRMFAYGMLAVVLALFLERVGLSRTQIGLLFALTMFGDLIVSMWLTTRADRFGRRRTLVVGAMLMLGSSVAFALSDAFWPLLVAATIGILSPSGNEVGPFLPVEQASFAEVVSPDRRIGVIAWYNLTGYLATALGALVGGLGTHRLQALGWSDLASFRAVIVAHGTVGIALAIAYACLSPAIEARAAKETRRLWLGLHESRNTVLRLCALFSLDAFAGGFVMQSLIAYWFHVRWGANEAQLGGMMFASNLCAGASALLAARIAKRFGLVATMVFSHLPSNVLLVLVPFMPNLELALAVLVLRFCLSQMDVPTRQAFMIAVVAPDERSAAGGLANVARSVGTTLAPLFTGLAFAVPSLGLPFVIGGGLKIVYDLALWRSCRSVTFPEQS